MDTDTDPDLKVTLVQADLTWESTEENLRRFDARLRDVADTHLIVLPEMFTTGFSMNPAAIAEPMTGKAVSWMLATARAKNADVAGSVAIEEGGRYFNRLLWAKPDGRLLQYDKKHLFSFAGEHERYTPGTSTLIVQVHGWNVAAHICYDLRFPVWSRNDLGKYDVAMYIASWPERRAQHWRALLTARAIENQAYVIGVNRVGTDGNGVVYSGDSMLIDPLGEIRIAERYVEAVKSATLSRNELDEVRAKFPFLKDADRYELRACEQGARPDRP